MCLLLLYISLNLGVCSLSIIIIYTHISLYCWVYMLVSISFLWIYICLVSFRFLWSYECVISVYISEVSVFVVNLNFFELLVCLNLHQFYLSIYGCVCFQFAFFELLGIFDINFISLGLWVCLLSIYIILE